MGLRVKRQSGVDLFHAIDWTSKNQRKVSYSAYCAEILTFAEANDRGYFFKGGLNSIFTKAVIKTELCTDSRCLYDTIARLHEGKEFRLRPTVQPLCNTSDSQETDFTNWIAGTSNPSDALTKRNPNTARVLNELVSTGMMYAGISSGYFVASAD